MTRLVLIERGPDEWLYLTSYIGRRVELLNGECELRVRIEAPKYAKQTARTWLRRKSPITIHADIPLTEAT